MTESAQFDLPLVFRANRLSMLLVGGGNVARQKYMVLRETGANVQIVARTFDSDFLHQLTDDKVICHHDAYHKKYLAGQNFVVAATSDLATNKLIASDCKNAGIFVNCVDQPELCDIVFPAVVRRGPLLLSITTRGKAPALTAWIRRKLEQWIDHSWIDFFWQLIDLRPSIKKHFPDYSSKNQLFANLFDHLERGDSTAASKELERASTGTWCTRKQGKVWIVGAGPGDSQLLTIKAARILGRADVVLYDSLVNKDILDYARREARLIDVGCRAHQNCQGTRQNTINHQLVDYARRGNTIVRLKGGDPCLFARAGEEIDALRQAEIDFQVIPGVSAFQAGAAAAGISMTKRNLSAQLYCISGHNIDQQTDLWWQQFYRTDTTWALYMASAKLSFLVGKLWRMSVPQSMSFAIIERASFPDEKVYKTTLGELYNSYIDSCSDSVIRTPALILMGSVVSDMPSFTNWNVYESGIPMREES